MRASAVEGAYAKRGGGFTGPDLCRALAALARVNRNDFLSSPALARGYEASIKARRIYYAADPLTCGFPDCWSRWRDLDRRYPTPARVYLDCEDAAAAHAGFMAARNVCGVRVGIVPGKQISHAVAGYSRPDGTIQIVDPCLWFGMPDAVDYSAPPFWCSL